jgi:hypothetical protein
MTVAIDVPVPVKTAVDDLVAAARESFGDALRSVILYGSAAEGRLRATSDVNLLFVLRAFDKRADAFRESFRFAQAALNVNAMFLLESELAEAGAAFAQKFADIASRHVVLHGDDVVSDLAISRDALVRRVRQVLLNLAIRLRELYVVRSLREEQCAITVAEAAGPLRTSAASILELESGKRIAPKEALEEVVGELGRDDLAALLPHLSEAREQRVLPPGEAASLLFATLELARALHDRAMRIN